MSVRKTPSAIKPLSDRFLLAVAFTVGSVIALLSTATDQLLMQCNIPGATDLVKWNAAAGVLSVLLIFKLMRWSRERNQLLRERERIATQLNHEVRNAIQVISLNDYHEFGAKATDVKLSINRIERALEEYVPHTLPISYPRENGRRLA